MISRIAAASCSVNGRSATRSPVRTGFPEKSMDGTVSHGEVGTESFSGGGGQSRLRPRLRGREATQARMVSAYQYGLPLSTWSGGGSRPCLR